MKDKEISKTLSYWLRHQPDAAGLTLDKAGWAPVDAILAQMGVGADDLARVVAENDKQRFELSDDGSRIRARQGHSIAVEGAWRPAAPPAWLFHGTVERFLPAIFAEGLKPMARHHVHLSSDEATATKVGERRGTPVILRVDAEALSATGQIFLLSDNGVWLTEAVPPAYLARV